MRATWRGDSSLNTRSFSKISTESKRAAAIAASFSGRLPLSETVAMEWRMTLPQRSGLITNGLVRANLGEATRIRSIHQASTDRTTSSATDSRRAFSAALEPMFRRKIREKV